MFDIQDFWSQCMNGSYKNLKNSLGRTIGKSLRCVLCNMLIIQNFVLVPCLVNQKILSTSVLYLLDTIFEFLSQFYHSKVGVELIVALDLYNLVCTCFLRVSWTKREADRKSDLTNRLDWVTSCALVDVIFTFYILLTFSSTCCVLSLSVYVIDKVWIDSLL